MQAAFQGRREFMSKHGLKMRYILLPTVAQLPVFIAFFSTLRAMAREAHLVDGIAAGGVAWFPALHLPDPTGLLPLASVILSVAAIRVNNNMQGMPNLGLSAGGQKVIFGGLSALFNTFALWMPSVSLAAGCRPRVPTRVRGRAWRERCVPPRVRFH
jgi:membrane protein insertase Oxa1/YidC/SpoIIIJ